ncbi:hypothetical protein TNCV_537851 [Trichonephila clavipes]|nr:hypothetical protein TNCV_537851 [Trichonephila clavipes]
MNVSVSDNRSKIVEVYGEETMSRQLVEKLYHSFQSGNQDVENHYVTGNERRSSSMTEINTILFEAMIQNDQRGLGLNSGEGMDTCKCIVPLRHGGTLNSRRATSPLVRLVERKERWVAPDHP